MRHPGPVHPPGRQGGEGQLPHLTPAGGFSVHQPNSTNPPPLAHTHSYPSHTLHVSKFPPPNHNQPTKSHTVTGAEDYSNFTLPPLNPGQRLAMSDQQKRSNPERRSKLPTLDNRKHNYASNPHRWGRNELKDLFQSYVTDQTYPCFQVLMLGNLHNQTLTLSLVCHSIVDLN